MSLKMMCVYSQGYTLCLTVLLEYLYPKIVKGGANRALYAGPHGLGGSVLLFLCMH